MKHSPVRASAAGVQQDTHAQTATVIALSVGSAYFLGAQIGLALTFPPSTTSVLWPPNAILTSALLLVPPRYWWLCLAAALPAHILLEIGAGFSPLLVLLLFVTNCSEALLAAGGLRLLGAVPQRFDSLAQVGPFICIAGFLAPVASSFLDAAVVHFVRDAPYWDVWRMRAFANPLTQLSIVPAVVLTIGALARMRRPSRARVVEAASLAAGLFLAAVLVFARPGVARLPGLPPTPSVLLLPLFFWAAIRFGVGGVSGALLVTAPVASASSSPGHRPFGLAPSESLMAVQMYLSIMGALLMCLASLLADRRRAASSLADRLRFEGVVSFIAASFVPPQDHASRSVYDTCLARIGAFFDADYASLRAAGSPTGIVARALHWRRHGSGEINELPGRIDLPWLQHQIDRGAVVSLSSLDELPPEAAIERRTWAHLEVSAVLATPLQSSGRVRGWLMIAAQRERVWEARDLEQLGLLAEVLANAIARQEAEFEVQRVRQELAQVAGLVSFGELASSLAHELNQPLGAILSNAQAASRMLEAPTLDRDELRAIASDIIDDDRRASAVISAMREMLSVSYSAPELVDINGVVQDVAPLVAIEAIVRDVSLTVQLAPQPARVWASRAQVQQAILNVLTHAMHSGWAAAVAPHIDVRVELDETRFVRVIVSHSGPAVHEQGPTGVHAFAPAAVIRGAGLSIARAIVAKHGGDITAAEHDQGARIVLAMPVSSE